VTTVVTVKKQVSELKQRLLPKPKRTIEIFWSIPLRNDQPHGKYGYQKTVIDLSSGKTEAYEAVSEAEEIESHRHYYEEKIPKYAKRLEKTFDWRTFEKYLETHLCNCGNFGHSGKVDSE